MDKRILLLQQKLLSNLEKRLTLKEMAKDLNISGSRLRQLFKTEMNATPNQYLRHLRLERAQQLLETTFLRIKEIGYCVGIRDQSNFVRDFKKKYGVTPTAYRLKFQIKENNPDS